MPFKEFSKSILKLPLLEYLEIYNGNFSYIDFNSLHNLKKIKYHFYKNFNQILSIKSLKEIHIITDLDYLDLTSIHDTNLSVNKLICNCRKDDDYELNYNINEILNKLPNLTDLFLITNLTDHRIVKGGWEDSKINLEINENSNCKINKITLILYFGDIKIYCQKFENLEKFEIKTYNDRPTTILNISNSLPMFSNYRKIIYNSLIELNLYLSQLIKVEIFKNLKNNIDYMPKLKKIYLHFTTDIDRTTYEEFIRKLLSLKLEFINIDISFNLRKFNFYNDKDDDEDDDWCYNDHNYSFEELKIINENILSLNFENIKIKKYIQEQ